jgi:hypothetical protein
MKIILLLLSIFLFFLISRVALLHSFFIFASILFNHPQILNVKKYRRNVTYLCFEKKNLWRTSIW